MKRALDVVPFLVLAYAAYGLFFRPRFVMWGLPSIWWFTMGGTMALIVITANFLWRDK